MKTIKWTYVSSVQSVPEGVKLLIEDVNGGFVHAMFDGRLYHIENSGRNLHHSDVKRFFETY